jgi:hypothetical protein
MTKSPGILSSTAGARDAIITYTPPRSEVVGLRGQDVPVDVALVEPLHDDDGRRALVVETVGHRLEYGSLTVPVQVWRTLQRLGSWVEPVLVNEWLALYALTASAWAG